MCMTAYGEIPLSDIDYFRRKPATLTDKEIAIFLSVESKTGCSRLKMRQLIEGFVYDEDGEQLAAGSAFD